MTTNPTPTAGAAPTSPGREQKSATRLDWRDRQHWGGTPKPCRLCGDPAYCRDDDDQPAHKVCVEAELASQEGTP